MTKRLILGRSGSPKISAGGKKLDHRTDIYSLGTVLYEFLCGRPPFSADTTIELLKKVANHLPRRPRKLNPKIPVKLEAVIMKAMEKDPSDRYQSAGQLAADLRAYLDGQPVSVRPPRFFERMDRFAKRHKVALTFAATLSLVVSISYRYVSGYIAQMRQRSALSTAEYFGARRVGSRKAVPLMSFPTLRVCCPRGTTKRRCPSTEGLRETAARSSTLSIHVLKWVPVMR